MKTIDMSYQYATDTTESVVAEPQIDLFRETQPENIEVEKIVRVYQEFENNFPIKVINRKQFNTPVNFKQAKEFPRHRWYTYKEGYSPQLVENFIKRFSKAETDVVFDPFGGIGTTVLQSAILNHQAYSNDINPLSNYVALVKADSYSEKDVEALNLTSSSLMQATLTLSALPPINDTVTSYFTTETLDSILKIKNWIEEIETTKIKNIFSIAFLTILETISTHRKDGNGVKRKTNYKQNFTVDKIKTLIANQIHLFIVDIQNTSIKVNPVIQHQSSFEPYTLKQKADLVITSPPYANCFDYSKVYLIELWFGGFFKSLIDQRIFRQSSITSHVHYKWEKRHQEFGHSFMNDEIAPYLTTLNLWDKKIPSMLVGYFSDMGKVLSELIPNLNSNATVGIVVGNSVYGGVPIATDVLLAQIARRLGFELVGIESYRTLTPSSQQLKIMREEDKKYLRESLIILKWI